MLKVTGFMKNWFMSGLDTCDLGQLLAPVICFFIQKGLIYPLPRRFVRIVGNLGLLRRYSATAPRLAIGGR